MVSQMPPKGKKEYYIPGQFIGNFKYNKKSQESCSQTNFQPVFISIKTCLKVLSSNGTYNKSPPSCPLLDCNRSWVLNSVSIVRSNGSLDTINRSLHVLKRLLNVVPPALSSCSCESTMSRNTSRALLEREERTTRAPSCVVTSLQKGKESKESKNKISLCVNSQAGKTKGHIFDVRDRHHSLKEEMTKCILSVEII